MITKTPWYSTLYKTFIYVSLILFIIYYMTTGETSVASLLTSFFIIILGLFMILVLTVNQIQQYSKNIGETLYQLFKQTGAILCILGFIGFLLYLVFTYKKLIVSNHISSSYGIFMNLSVLLIFSQIYILLQNQTPEGYIQISGITSGILYLLNIILFVCVNIIYTTLTYFTTDGFQNLTPITLNTPLHPRG